MTNRVHMDSLHSAELLYFNDHVNNKATRLPIILKQSSRTIHMHVMGVCTTLDSYVSSVCGNICIS